MSAMSAFHKFRSKEQIMRPRIQDEFTKLPISRQRKYQLRMQRDRRCTECGQPAVQGSRCLKHLVKARERQRKKRGLKRRYYGTLSYKLEAMQRGGKPRSARQAASGRAPAGRHARVGLGRGLGKRSTHKHAM